MSARKSKKSSINLLPREEFEASMGGRILRWGVTSFRYIVIATEIVVMGAFVSRFWLDTAISDLNDELEQKKAVIASYSTLEKNFREVKTKLKVYSEINQNGNDYVNLLDKVSSYLPDDTLLSSLSMDAGEVKIKAQSLSEKSIDQFLVNLEETPLFANIELSQVETNTGSPFISFTLLGSLN